MELNGKITIVERQSKSGNTFKVIVFTASNGSTIELGTEYNNAQAISSILFAIMTNRK